MIIITLLTSVLTSVTQSLNHQAVYGLHLASLLALGHPT